MKRSDLLKRLYLTGVGILLATAGIAQTHNTYTNPLRTADGKMIRVADPFVFRYDSLYYMTGTTRQNSEKPHNCKVWKCCDGGFYDTGDYVVGCAGYICNVKI